MLASLAGVARSSQPDPLGAPLPSDPRATFVQGNVTTCAAAGFAASTQAGGHGGSSAADANVAGTVSPNAGTISPGQGQELNVTITGTGVVIDALVVKGGPAYNLYSDPAVLPPALPPTQHYISPRNGGGNIPAISHWFVRYHTTTPPPAGSLTVEKVVISPDGVPVTSLPTSFTAVGELQ